jgi:Uma2 family endonuclease
MALTEPRMTLEEFLALPEREPALEFEDGVVTQKVSPNIWHSALQAAFVELINGYARPRKLARAFPELRTAHARASRVPDVAVYTWSRISREAGGGLAFKKTSEPPDIAIEILSPGQTANAMMRRLLSFVAAGTRVAVLADPDDRSLLTVRPGPEIAVLRVGETLDLGDVIPGLRIDLGVLFDALRD